MQPQSTQRAYGNNNAPIRQNSTTVLNAPVATTHGSSLKESIAYMYSEERLAKDIYLNIYKVQPLKQLYNIATRAETRHIDSVNDLARKYGVPTRNFQSGQYPEAELQSLYNRLYAKGVRSQKDALEVGCMVEVVDIDDLNKYMAQAQAENAQDALATFDFLRKGSYKHYGAFDRSLKNMGVQNGCCSLGQTYCHPEYPQTTQGGRGHGGGQGRGMGRGGQGWR